MSNPKSNDLFPNMSVDELINSISDEIDESSSQSSKSWSIDEIDALLGLSEEKSKSDKQQVDVKPQSQVVEKTTQEPPVQKQQVEEKKQDEPKPVEKEPIDFDDSYFIDQNDEQNFVVEKVKEPKDNKKVADDKTKLFEELEHSSNKKEQENIEEKRKEEELKEKLEQEEKEKKHKEFLKSVTDDPKEVLDLANEYAPSKDVTKSPLNQVTEKTLADVVPTYNENIKHNIIKNKVEKPAGGIETDKYRNRFINAPVQHIERTAEYAANHVNDPKPFVERPGFIVKKKDFKGTADLEPIPTIVSATEELDKTKVEDSKNKKVEKSKKENEEELEGQIKLSGFNEEEKIDQIDEEEAEQELRNKRVDKIKEFKITPDFVDFPTQALGQQLDDVDFESEEEIEEEIIDDEIEFEENEKTEIPAGFKEYESKEDKPDLLKKLAKQCKMAFSFAIVETVIFAVSLVINIIFNSTGLTLMGGLNELTFVLVNMLFLLLSSAFAIEATTKGLVGLFTFKPNASTGSFVTFLLSLIQLIILTITYKNGIPEETIIFAPIACFAMMCNSYSRYITLKRVQGNFDFCTGGTGLYSTQKIAKEEDAFEIGRGLLLGEPDVRYSAKIKFPTNFMQNSFAHNPVDSLCKIIVPIVLGVSAIVAVVQGFLTKDALVSYNSFVAVSAIGIPLFSLFVSNLPLFMINKKLNKNGCALLGHNPAFECNGTNAIIVDSSDLFMQGYCNIDGIKTFHNMRIDEAILDAAALVIKAGGPLVSVFDGVILNRREILPPVESIAYEERLGLSAWIQSRRILLGSRDLLKHHNVEVPDSDVEKKYLKRGKKIIYLSVAGKIAAMFVISYYANDNVKNVLQGIEDSGVTTLIKTCDCNITEDMICNYFDLDENSIKIISPMSGEIFDSYRNETLDTSDTGIYHNGTDDSFIQSVIQSLRLNKIVSINSIVQIVYTCVSVIAVSLMIFLADQSTITPDKIIVFQAVFGLIASLVSVIKRN